MKTYTKVSDDVQIVGDRFKRGVVIKKFQTEDGLEHEFTTWLDEGYRAAGVIAITVDKKVVITYQFRGGPERWMYEIPGGGVEAGEDPEVGAVRELEEETGYMPGQVEFLGTSCKDAYSNIVTHYYLATDCVLSDEGNRLDEEEQEQGVEIRLITIDELIENAKNDQMTDPHAVLMAYEKLKELNR
jgi:ADP-ribose pyrophosphatase